MNILEKFMSLKLSNNLCILDFNYILFSNNSKKGGASGDESRNDSLPNSDGEKGGIFYKKNAGSLKENNKLKKVIKSTDEESDKLVLLSLNFLSVYVSPY